MCQVTLDVPDEIRLALKATPDDLAFKIRFAASVKLYEMGQLSAGAAAQLAGVSEPHFLSHLADYGVTNCDPGEDELVRPRPATGLSVWHLGGAGRLHRRDLYDDAR